MYIRQFRTVTETTSRVRNKMNELASMLPEYDTVMAMCGVGKALGLQLIAEIGDVSRFTHREATTAFAGVDPGVDESGKHVSKSNRSSKCGSSRLRRSLFPVMSVLPKTKPVDPVYFFLDRKRSERKPYNVYMTAGANNFLQIYYGKVKACLAVQEKAD